MRLIPPTFIQCRFFNSLFKLNLWDYSSMTDTLRYYQAFNTHYVPLIYLTSDNKAVLSWAQTLSLNEYLQDLPVVIVRPEQNSCSISCLWSSFYQMLPKKGKTTHNATGWTCNSIPRRENTSSAPGGEPLIVCSDSSEEWSLQIIHF